MVKFRCECASAQGSLKRLRRCNPVAAMVPLAKMMSGLSPSNSAAYSALRSALSSVQRVPIRTLRPTFQPNSYKPW
jgi:hypothetical protein